ncbi:MAG: nucleotide exchange factor GrpE [Spirochaetota bacterium]
MKRQRFPFIISPYARSGVAPELVTPETEFFKHLVPILDGLEAVREAIATGGEESWLKGLDLFRGKLHDLLGTGGFKALAKVGNLFDPALHEAIGVESGTGLPEGTIAQVVQQGWVLGDLVLRYAKVTVARNS